MDSSSQGRGGKQIPSKRLSCEFILQWGKRMGKTTQLGGNEEGMGEHEVLYEADWTQDGSIGNETATLREFGKLQNEDLV